MFVAEPIGWKLDQIAQILPPDLADPSLVACRDQFERGDDQPGSRTRGFSRSRRLSRPIRCRL